MSTNRITFNNITFKRIPFIINDTDYHVLVPSGKPVYDPSGDLAYTFCSTLKQVQALISFSSPPVFICTYKNGLIEAIQVPSKGSLYIKLEPLLSSPGSKKFNHTIMDLFNVYVINNVASREKISTADVTNLTTDIDKLNEQLMTDLTTDIDNLNEKLRVLELSRNVTP